MKVMHSLHSHNLPHAACDAGDSKAGDSSVSSTAFGIAGTPLQAWQASRSLAAVPPITLDALVPDNARVIVVAPHPDDEVLAFGGLLAGLVEREIGITLVSVTDGEGSHPDSEAWPTHRLRKTRRQESREAMELLGFSAEKLDWHYLNLPDGAVAAHMLALEAQLGNIARPGDCLLTTWRGDGHCDHEAVGAAVAACARRRGARLIEAPVWAWHWATPEDARLPWPGARKLLLDDQRLAAKRSAVLAHLSQLQNDPSTQAGPVLDSAVLDRLLQPFELFFI